VLKQKHKFNLAPSCMGVYFWKKKKKKMMMMMCWELENEQKRLVKNVLVLTAVFAPFFLGMLWKLEEEEEEEEFVICQESVCLLLFSLSFSKGLMMQGDI